MLTTYRRHTKRCPHRSEGRQYRRCRCPIWVDGMLNGEEIRQSLGMRDWTKAQETIRDWEADGERKQLAESEPMSITAACEEFITDLRRRKVTDSTVRKYALLFRGLEAHTDDKGIRHLKNVDLPLLRSFCTTWTEAAQTQAKKLERLRAFLRFAMDSRWIDSNPAKQIKPPKVRPVPTMPFTQDEMVGILTACDTYPDCYGRCGQWNGRRLKALVLLMRYSGLRIGDAVWLSKERITDGRLLLDTAKSGVSVCVQLPPFVIEELSKVKSISNQHHFWSGTSDRDGVARDFMRYLNWVFKLAGLPDGHSHRFRDTFAVELLLAGVPIERVSVLLGHSSVRITERHYAPWVRARQEQLEADVRRTWGIDPVAFVSTKGTPEAHENQEVVN